MQWYQLMVRWRWGRTSIQTGSRHRHTSGICRLVHRRKCGRRGRRLQKNYSDSERCHGMCEMGANPIIAGANVCCAIAVALHDKCQDQCHHMCSGRVCGHLHALDIRYQVVIHVLISSHQQNARCPGQRHACSFGTRDTIHQKLYRWQRYRSCFGTSPCCSRARAILGRGR